ncbi:MAG: hypothetical protein ACYCZF_13275 [Anaerolineae bacterium]
MPAPGIVNIINFIRAYEPRDPELDLLEPVVRQIELVQANNLPATWLLQYDTLLDDRFVSLLKSQLDTRQEVGAWFEVMQPLVERAGLVWRGRYAWDWHSHVGFSIGYTPFERERLADVFMSEFRRIWGYYPASVGSWLMDAHLLGYLADRYHVQASCTCKDQWGTDGYTMWGGYYSQAFYPSRENAFMPAQTIEMQIPIPVFRMLGSDPIYQYDVAATANGQRVITLEPIYTGDGGGGDPAWVRWFFKTTFTTPALSFGYAQVGQENPFGWPAMRAGYSDQIALVAEWQKAGRLRVATLADTGRWFCERYPVTPASDITALEDWRHQGHASVWYCSRFYRMNLFWEGDRCWVRDIHLFDERYAERYLNTVCANKDCTYDTLPVVDGLLWGARLEPVVLDQNGCPQPLRGGQATVTEQDADTLVVDWPLCEGGSLSISCSTDRIMFESTLPRWGLWLHWADDKPTAISEITPQVLVFQHEGFHYRVGCISGEINTNPSGSGIFFSADGHSMELDLGIR